jgi:putative transposase
MAAAVAELAPVVGVAAACRALGVPRSSYYRAGGPGVPPAAAEAGAPPPARPPGRPTAAAPARAASPRALAAAEREAVRAVLDSERFADCAPRQVYATLLDEGVYLCSWSTMYRLLRERGETTPRRDRPRRSAYAKPELLATGPRQLWSWDITKLKGPATWEHFHLYVILDVFSRYAVGWTIAAGESAALAEALIAETCAKEGIAPEQLTIHADRGGAMTSKCVAQLLVDLGVAKSHSRPHTADDNPFSEAHFKTVKHHPTFPDRFGSLADARSWARAFFQWYNHEHRHSGIGLLTPATVHLGRAPAVTAARQGVLAAAYQAHPERFVRGRPQPPAPPTAVWINPPAAPATPTAPSPAASGAAAVP